MCFIFYFRKNYFLLFSIILLKFLIFNFISDFDYSSISILHKLTSQTSLDTISIYNHLFSDYELFGKSLNSVGISQSLYDRATKFSVFSVLIWLLLYIFILYLVFKHRIKNIWLSLSCLYLAISILKDPTHSIPSFIVLFVIVNCLSLPNYRSIYEFN